MNLNEFNFLRADLNPLGNSGVVGQVNLFSRQANSGVVCFVGSATGLEPDLLSVHGSADGAADCTATNGCGAHVHSGEGSDACTNSTTQGGHYWNADVMDSDPWAVVGYFQTSSSGVGNFAGCVPTGVSGGFEDRAFIIHANDGSRVACGVLQPASPYADNFVDKYSATTEPLGDSGVTGDITVVAFPDFYGSVCFLGDATGLEPTLESYHVGGSDCTASNGCGTHIHSGTDCLEEFQGGHYYNDALVPVDPWMTVGYTTTSANGEAGHFYDCLVDGHSYYDSKPFIIHANDGSRVSCGLLEKTPIDPTSAAVPVLAASNMFVMWLAIMLSAVFIRRN